MIKTETTAPITRGNLQGMIRENLECEPASSNLELVDLRCEKCHTTLSMKNKLDLENLLFKSEDTDFKKKMNERLANIESLLMKLTNSR